ncbi:MAG TPA: SIMPL domain-containing protein [candidate division Zixibacteria bacterium]|nr:SIMPL domain-containing protein [candidate division Zixibacteria bacterium]
MNQITNPQNRSSLVIASVILGIVLIICTVIGARTLVKIKGLGNTIRVTGAAAKPIKSDYAIWTGSFSVNGATVEEAYPLLEIDLRKITSFMKKKKLDSSEFEISPVNIITNYNRERQIVDYTLSRTIQVEMADVERLGKISESASELIKDGVLFESRTPQYLVSELDTLKVEMIRAATENAKIRAEELARTTGNSIGAPRTASVGVFQIRPRHSQEVSSYGISDVTSIEKEIVLTVHIEFLID